MPKWEYTVKQENEKLDIRDLNSFGQEGWELVSVITRCVGEGWEYDYIFKRETKHIPGRR